MKNKTKLEEKDWRDVIRTCNEQIRNAMITLEITERTKEHAEKRLQEIIEKIGEDEKNESLNN